MLIRHHQAKKQRKLRALLAKRARRARRSGGESGRCLRDGNTLMLPEGTTVTIPPIGGPGRPTADVVPPITSTFTTARGMTIIFPNGISMVASWGDGGTDNGVITWEHRKRGSITLPIGHHVILGSGSRIVPDKGTSLILPDGSSIQSSTLLPSGTTLTVFAETASALDTLREPSCVPRECLLPGTMSMGRCQCMIVPRGRSITLGPGGATLLGTLCLGGPTMLPQKMTVRAAFSFPPGTPLLEQAVPSSEGSHKLTAGIDLHSGTVIPGNVWVGSENHLPTGTVLPGWTRIYGETVFPPGTILPRGLILPTGTRLSGGAVLSGRLNLPGVE